MEHLSFGAIEVLWWLIPLLFMLWWGRGKLQQRLYILEQLRADVQFKKTASRRHFGIAIVLFSLVLALSFPRFGYQQVQRESLSRDIWVVLDFSSSMWAEDIQPSRMARAKREVIDLTSLLQGDRVGLIGFAAEAYAQMPLTKDYDVLHKVLRDTSPEDFRSQGSNLAAGIQLAVEMFSRSATSQKSIVVISDGENHQQDLEEAVAQAREQGIRIYSLGIGGDVGVPIPLPSGGFLRNGKDEIVMSKREKTVLQYISASTEGALASSVATTADVQALYTDGIQQLTKEVIQTTQQDKIWNEVFQWPLVVALFGLLWMMFPSHLVSKKGLVLMAMVAFIVPVKAEEGLEGSLAELEYQAIALLRNKDPLRAQHLFQIIVSQATDAQMLQRSRYNAGLAAYQSGQLDLAVQYWETIAESNPLAQKNLLAVRKEIEKRRQQAATQQEKDSSAAAQQNLRKEQTAEHPEPQRVEQRDGQPSANEIISSSEKQSIDFSKEEARRLLESVQEGKINGMHRGFGHEEKNW